MTQMADEEAQKEYDNGLRILARWIARAHLRELAKQQKISAKPPESQPAAGNGQPGLSAKLMSLDAQERLVQGARRGGQKGGVKPKHFTPESKQRQIHGASKGGQHSHIHDLKD